MVADAVVPRMSDSAAFGGRLEPLENKKQRMLNLTPCHTKNEVNPARVGNGFGHFADYARWRARTSSVRVWARRTMRPILAVAFVVLFESGCGAREMEMNVVVFNYWPRAMADVYVNGQHVGAGYGANGPGGTGSKISCCYSIKPGAIKVGWMLDRSEEHTLNSSHPRLSRMPSSA